MDCGEGAVSESCLFSAAVNLGVGGFSHDEIVAAVKTVPKSQR